MLQRPPNAIAGLLCLAAGMAQADAGGLNWPRDGLAAPAAPAAATGWRNPLLAAPVKSGNRALNLNQAPQPDPWPLRVSASVFAERGLTPANAGVLKYRWQLQSRWAAPVQLGMQGTGELGPWHDWWPGTVQAQRLGPALFSSWNRAQGQPLQLQAACLTDFTSGRGSSLLTLRLHSAF